MQLILYIIIAFINVFIHVLKTIMVIKSTKFWASFANCVCYTFSAVVIKCIAETDLLTAICVQAATNFFGCYLAMWVCEIVDNHRRKRNIIKEAHKYLKTHPTSFI